MDLLEALATRRSVRGFRPDPVPRETVERIFAAAQQSPSWCNIQPWRVWVTMGAARDRLIGGLTAAFAAGPPHPDVPFPSDYPEPYDRHRKDCGKALYEAMGVVRGDAEGRLAAWKRNFVAFDAPVVALVGIDRRFGIYASLDVGCWLESVLLLATAEGLSTCAQASLATYPTAAREVLGIGDEVTLLFGIAIGWEDPAVPANACRTTRSPLADNVHILE
jgi:nitroreductase